MEEFVEDYYLEPSEIDWEYEFDAARFFDFSFPESDKEAEEAERWFSVAGNYPVSPIVMKLKRGGGIQREENTITSCSSLNDGKNDNNEDVDIGCEGSLSGKEGATKTKATSVPRPRTSTLMNPTASHLAKLNKARDSVSNQSCGRFQKSPIHIDQRSLQKSHVLDNVATKRQKLEIGYLRKVSQLKHQALLLHKKSQKVHSMEGTVTPKTAHSKMKLTIPKEPELETLQRALSRRSRTNSESSDLSELEIQTCSSRSLNRKIFKAPMVIPPKKCKPQLPVFQVFNFKTTERALQRSSTNEMKTYNFDRISQSNPADLKRSSLDDAVKKEKYETPLKIKAQSISNKGSKENAPDCFQPEFWRCGGKLNPSRSSKAIAGTVYESNMNRSYWKPANLLCGRRENSVWGKEGGG
ncbi:hypothetical protein ACH5RR_019613 [Cinchona calisaya]|uniref:TPX2 central domain-containing protein n=1 Tax=Cinchona calisaya TaxID=153742 RepID=A0ABD2ZQS6_9GENT